MDSGRSRGFGLVALAIIMAGLVVGASIFAASALGGTHTATVTVLRTTTSTQTQTTPSNPSTLYELTFQQVPECPYGSLAGVYLAPWSVTLNGTTITNPPSGVVGGAGFSSTNSTYSTIVFSVPSGTYSYVVGPSQAYLAGAGQARTVNVYGNDTSVKVDQDLASCGSTVTTTSTSSTCSGSPPVGDCISAYSYTFALSVNYTGSWKLAYEGCSGLGTCSPTPVTGSLNGTGYYSKAVTLTGLDNSGLTLCAQAQKLDGSNATLILTVTGYAETSLPYGSVSFCGGVVP
jgi:hypothetical protein